MKDNGFEQPTKEPVRPPYYSDPDAIAWGGCFILVILFLFWKFA